MVWQGTGPTCSSASRSASHCAAAVAGTGQLSGSGAVSPGSPEGVTCRNGTETSAPRCAIVSDVTFMAIAVYPYADVERATVALRGELRRQAAAQCLNIDWSTLTVAGPSEDPGAHGQNWYQWTASVSVG